MERFSRDLVWQRTVEPGFEHVQLRDQDGLHARGTMTAAQPRPYTCRYTLVTDDLWRTQLLEVETEGAGWRRRVRLERDIDGWRVTTHQQGASAGPLPGIELPELLVDAVDPDVGYSPLFNSLPVHRDALLDRPPGTSITYTMAFVSLPDLVVAPSEQTYTVLDNRRIQYASGDFTADLEFDQDGYVYHYPGLASRV